MTDAKEGLFWHRVKLLAYIFVFLAPFVGGWLALYVFDVRPESGNYGSLVQPVKKIQWSQLQARDGQIFENGFGKKWAFMLIARDDCGASCQSNLFYMRQIKKLLARNTERMQNVLISTGSLNDEMQVFLKDYPNFVVIENFDNAALLDQFAVDKRSPDTPEPYLFLVDPDHNFMMFYPKESDEHRILEDIRKLMKLSKIG